MQPTDSPPLAFLLTDTGRQAIGWASFPDDLDVDHDNTGALVLYEGESTSEGFGGLDECEPEDAWDVLRERSRGDDPTCLVGAVGTDDQMAAAETWLAAVGSPVPMLPPSPENNGIK